MFGFFKLLILYIQLKQWTVNNKKYKFGNMFSLSSDIMDYNSNNFIAF